MVTKLKIPSPAKAKKYFQDKMAFTTGPVELERMVAQGQPVHIVDVRSGEDYAEGHIPGAVNLPKDQWTDAKIVKTRLRKDRINVVYCYSHVCHLAATAAIGFASKGYPVMELDAGGAGGRKTTLPSRSKPGHYFPLEALHAEVEAEDAPL